MTTPRDAPVLPFDNLRELLRRPQRHAVLKQLMIHIPFRNLLQSGDSLPGARAVQLGDQVVMSIPENDEPKSTTLMMVMRVVGGQRHFSSEPLVTLAPGSVLGGVRDAVVVGLPGGTSPPSRSSTLKLPTGYSRDLHNRGPVAISRLDYFQGGDPDATVLMIAAPGSTSVAGVGASGGQILWADAAEAFCKRFDPLVLAGEMRFFDVGPTDNSSGVLR